MFRQVKIKILSSIKKKLEPRFQAQIATTKLYGKLITVNINGRDVKMRHHSSGRKNAPVYIDIHGGGWAWGGLRAPAPAPPAAPPPPPSGMGKSEDS